MFWVRFSLKFWFFSASVHPRLAHPVLPHAALLVQLHVPGVSFCSEGPSQPGSGSGPSLGSSFLCHQRGVSDLQRGGGLSNGCHGDLELRRRGHAVHPLEGAAAAAAGLPHPHQRTHGPCLHQVSPRVVHLGHPGRHLCLW